MSDQPRWHHAINCGSVYFLELKDVTVFIIIMKIIIMMMIIMMVIKRKKTYCECYISTTHADAPL